MSSGIKIKTLLIVLAFFSLCFAQGRRIPQTRRPTPTRSTPEFVKKLASYTETPQVTKAVFKNGMTVIVNEYRARPVVSAQVYVRAGFLNDPLNAPGTARLLESIIYRGTSEDPMGTIREVTQAFGGMLRSSTEHEYTRFEIIAPSSQWKKALNIQAEALLNPPLDPDTMKIEARSIAGEVQEFLDNPNEYVLEKLLELGFNQPRISKYSSKSMESLDDLTGQNLAAFYQSAYVPGRMLLVVSGDVSTSEVLNQVVHAYDKPPIAAAKVSAIPFQTSQDSFRYSGLRGNVPTPQILLGFHMVPGDHRDYPALKVLSAILGMGEGSVLNRRLRDQKKVILGQKTTLSDYGDFGYLTLQVETEFEDIDRSEIEILTEIELLKRRKIGDAEIARARAQLEREYWIDLETVTGRARNLAYFEMQGDWKRMERYVSNLADVGPSDIQRVAKKYLSLENCSLVEYLPDSAKERNLTTDSIRRTLEGLIKPSADQEQEKRSKETVLSMDIPQATNSYKFSEIRYPVQTASILRGPDIFIREDHTSPLINMGLFFPGGKFVETDLNSGITKVMIRMMLRGTQKTDAIRFHRQLELYGGDVRPVVSDDYFGFYFSILSKNFEAGFKLLLEAVKSPSFDQEEVDRQKRIQTIEILKRRQSETYARDLMRRALFKGFSYGRSPDGTEESLSGLTPQHLQSWYNLRVKSRKPIVAIIGDFKGTSLASYFVRNFSGSRFIDSEISADYVNPLDSGESIETNVNANEDLILIGFQAPPKDDEDRYAAAVIESYAGGLGRLSEELRDRYGVAHKVSLKYSARLRGGSIIGVAALNPGYEEAALKILKEEIELMAAGPKTNRDYRSAVNSAVGSFAIKSQFRFAQISDIVENVLAGNGIEGYRSYPVFLQDVSEENLKDVIRRIFDMDKAVILRVQKRSSRDQLPIR